LDSSIISALIALAGSLLGTLGGIMVSNKLTAYRLEQLEKKVDKHNNVRERVALMEQNEKTIWRRVDELRSEVHEMKEGREHEQV
jgi:flagellar motor component MotA